MAHTKNFFLTISERVLSNWTALKLAVDHGMGSREKAEDFPSYITEVLYMNENLDSDDVAAEIEEYMDEAFQTELQDDSAIDVAKELLRFYQYCLAGDESTAVIELAKLPPSQTWITGRKPGSDSQGQGRQQVVTTEQNNSIENIEKMEEDDGWTEVKTRKQK
ncbi:pre-rRNA-processing protein TSR2 homolog [Athalia rosae]|uniref:pre-rRNA-processing protein TSR2 homolog n=1 Tax=Athalia rosae TaxID=37344 RepID=UPI0020346855|nr:pre-rRNA-processing protein TSR2 homolog [Athalia rosae]XP_048511992.1 pre-rRNA-processing protein TSR2 homolog [Athalia rosae]XP_048511993.1 pre-rRNA-processing protein TSR2 homolog [Athalia rosae]XP_048511994.1 pre-rRNA-processing protein TSR2 homolog [Athalia rosae]